MSERIFTTDLRPGDREEEIEVLDPEALASALAAEPGVAGITTRGGKIYVVIAPNAQRDIVVVLAAEAAVTIDDQVAARGLATPPDDVSMSPTEAPRG